MIELKNISKKFGGHQVLSDISAVFERGKTNLIIGQSGSGKTVLLKCIVGLFEVDMGEIIYDSVVFSRMKNRERKEIRKQIGMVFQGGALFDSITVEENVIYPLDMFTDLTLIQKIERANFCLDRVNITNANKLFPSELSGGMKKRVAIARAIAIKPKYLFFDEPNSGLDPQNAILIDKLIREITIEFNTTTIVNTHDMNSVIEIGDKIIFIDQGKKWWEGDKNNFLNSNNKELNDFIFATRLMQIVGESESNRKSGY
ncbi:MAG: ATP-binding cassette domain-containing protein [Bacteroidia bacterium]|nr:ATP-binding cassette domain-containing protein [Bacteroidia bacterium]